MAKAHDRYLGNLTTDITAVAWSTAYGAGPIKVLKRC
jgi:hypothetical protein